MKTKTPTMLSVLPNKPVLLFDMDDTLAESKQALDQTMTNLLAELLKNNIKIGVISGGKFQQFKKQMISQFTPSTQKYFENLIILPTSGASFFKWNSETKNWDNVYSHPLSAQEKTMITEAFKQVKQTHKDFLLPSEQDLFGQQLEDRETQMTFSALGQQAPPHNKKTWDQDQQKRKTIVAFITPLLPLNLSIRIGGTTSIDISKPGIDKGFGIEELIKHSNIKKEDIHFIGDKLQPGGNDHAVIKTGVTTTEVSCWQDTYKLLQKYRINFVEGVQK